MPRGPRPRRLKRGPHNASFDVLARVGTDGATLRLEDCRIMMNGEKPDQASEQALINALNPVIDFAKDLDLLDAVKAETVLIKNDAVVVRGQVKIPEMPI